MEVNLLEIRVGFRVSNFKNLIPAQTVGTSQVSVLATQTGGPPVDSKNDLFSTYFSQFMEGKIRVCTIVSVCVKGSDAEVMEKVEIVDARLISDHMIGLWDIFLTNYLLEEIVCPTKLSDEVINS